MTPRRSTTRGASATTCEVVDVRMGGDDAREVGRRQRVGQGHGRQSELRDLGDVRIVVGDLGAVLAQQLGRSAARALAHVADVLLVGDAEEQRSASR